MFFPDNVSAYPILIQFVDYKKNKYCIITRNSMCIFKQDAILFAKKGSKYVQCYQLNQIPCTLL
jgi:hypothetical protein